MNSSPLRFVIYHVHPVSARLRFLVSPNGNVCFPKCLPKASGLQKSDNFVPPTVCAFPTTYIDNGCKDCSIPSNNIQFEKGFKRWINTKDDDIPVYAMRVTGDQPFKEPEGYHWIELMDCFRLVRAERLLLKELYEWVLY